MAKLKNVKKNTNADSNVNSSETKSAVKKINTAIFGYFKNLTSENEADRLSAGFGLINHLNKTTDVSKRSDEVEYALKRLVRGVGGSTTHSRAGFFSTLVSLLTCISEDEISVSTILQTANKQLHFGGTISNKEDADAIVGQILTCGAILRSNRLQSISVENLNNIIEILTTATKHRTYHVSLAYSVLAEYIQQVSEKQFKESVLPCVEPEICKPWPKQNINTIFCVIVAQKKFSNIITPKYLKKHFGGTQLLHSDSFEYLFKIFWENNNANIITHPAFETFGGYAASCNELNSFWDKYVDKCLKTPTKLQEIQTLKILTDIFDKADPTKISIPKLLSPNLISMIVASLKAIKIKKDETVKAFYNDFFESLNECHKKIDTDDEKVEIIKRLIIYPGIVNMEKFTTNRVIHQLIANLGETGVQTIFDVYKNIILDKTTKDPTNKNEIWLNYERESIGYVLQNLMQHKSVKNSIDWRIEQLKFFLSFGVFYTNSEGNIVNKEQASELSNEISTQMKNIFYASLQFKLPLLTDEKKILFNLVEFINTQIIKIKSSQFIRTKIDEKALKVWNEMYTEVNKSSKKNKVDKKNDDKLKLVFHILLLHMGIQLFKDPELAESAILDLEKCMERMKKSNKTAKTKTIDEPEWIEVVTDLFLHLLSQNSSSLRNVVNSVFPSICENLSLTSIHQILAVLNMKDGQNPLSENGDDDEDNSIGNDNDDEDENSSEEEDEDDEESGESVEEDNDDDDGDDDDDDDDDEDESDVEMYEEGDENVEEEVGSADKFRSALFNALKSTGVDSDQVSIDLNDLDEEEGNRFDEALSIAMQSLKKPEGKRSKSHRIKTTTTMHFRIRVLDLIEIYIQNKPKLLVTIEIMHALFDMIEFCQEKELQPLALKVDKVLTKLTNLKQFGSIDDVTVNNLSDFLRLIIEKKARSKTIEAHNKLRSRCCRFLIGCTKLINPSDDKPAKDLLKLLTEYLEDFVKSRNPTITITLLNDIFQMRWHGVLDLASSLVKTSLAPTTRTFRRIQVLELLVTLFNNQELIKQTANSSIKAIKCIEKSVEKHLELMSKKECNQISIKEFNIILDVLCAAKRCHLRIKLLSDINNENVSSFVLKIRKMIKLDSTQSYKKFCNVFKQQFVKNSEVTLPALLNGKGTSNSSDEEEKVKKIAKPIVKRKTITTDFRKEKKLKKEERFRVSSDGLNSNVSFLNVQIDVEFSNGSTNKLNGFKDTESESSD